MGCIFIFSGKEGNIVKLHLPKLNDPLQVGQTKKERIPLHVGRGVYICSYLGTKDIENN